MNQEIEGHQSVEEVRREKLNKIIQMGIIPYADRGEKTADIAAILSNFEKWMEKDIFVCGRIMAIRKHGKAIFADLKDDSAEIQLHIKADNFSNNEFEFFDELIDIGDFLQIYGKCFKTKRGEKSVEVSMFKLLSKSLLPLPEKWKGLQDAEKRYRWRYLDLLTNDQIRDRFRLRARMISAMRKFMDERGFLEVETPVLQSSAGGAIAKPFLSYYDAMDCPVKLRIAPELYLKRLLVAGYEKVYEIGKVYRNEGRDPSHLPEFTMFEFYQAYSNYEDLMTMTEEMIAKVLKDTVGRMSVKIGEHNIDLIPPYPRKNIFEIIKEYGGQDLSQYKTAQDLLTYIRQAGIKIEGNLEKFGYGKLLDEIYKKIARPKVIDPVFLIDHPIELSPLARKKDADPTRVDRFQLIVNGWEICNSFSELIDPVDQEERFKIQSSLRSGGDEEAHEFDEDYVEAMKYGMPPIAGWGMGLDRMMSLLTGVDNLRELILFPFVKKKEKEEKDNIIVDKKEIIDNPPIKPSKELLDDLDSKLLASDLFDDNELDKLNIETMGISHADALELMKNNLESKNLQKHSLAVEAILKKVAQKIGADEDVWSIAGLLHDIDYEKTMKEPTRHCLLTEGILKAKKVSPLIIQAIKAHNPECGGKRKTRLDYALYAIDPLSGFIIACALVTPDKKLTNLTVESILRKYKEKSFAKSANREAMLSIVQLGIELEDFVELGLEALKEISQELEL
ncbi:MAG: lysine--tRNA ligase [Patescibacteria group bacterium]